MLNYRGGLADRPFWNMLSISPVVHGGRLMFYLANLQDYTYHMAKLVSLSPAQFCRSAEHHQRVCRLPDRPADELHVRFFAKPAVFETDSNHPITEYQPSGQDAVPHLQMKRLGWANLLLEPEHLTDRVVDALQSLDARYERVESVTGDEDVFVVNAEMHGVAARLLITRDPDAHEAFRQLRQLLGDAVQGGVPLNKLGLSKLQQSS